MPSLEIELVDVAYAHLDSVPLLSHVQLRLACGWTGVVGANGAGKTTLLRLLHGSISPDAGTIRRPAGLRSAFCPQRVDRCDAAVRRFAELPTREAARLRGRLDLHADALLRWSALSPGERKRWQVGSALVDEPGLLLLDEPTNHLDEDARRLLVDTLAAHRGIGVVVSHDRELLARLSHSTLRIAGGSAQLFPLSYPAARREWEEAERQAQRHVERLRGERRQLRDRLTRQRARRDHAQARTRTSRRMKGPRDNATAGGLKMSRRRSAVNALGRDIRKLHGAMERLDRRAAGVRFTKTLGRSLFVDWAPAPEGELARLDLERLTVGRGDAQHVLLRDVHAALWPSDRIWLSGRNGSGKSTLVAALRDRLRVPEERLLCMPQELDADTGLALLEALRALPDEARGQRLQIVAALGVDPDALLASALPSPGEARKLALADALARRVWGLVLDEPTNHLDLPSLERLEEALSDFPGALLLVSHDATFASRLADTRWHLQNGRLHIIPLSPEGPPQPPGASLR